MIAVSTLGLKIEATSPHDDFLALKDVVERYANFAFRGLAEPDREEPVAEAVAAALKSFVSLKRRGRDPFRFSSVIALRAVQDVRAGRRVGSEDNARDVFAWQDGSAADSGSKASVRQTARGEKPSWITPALRFPDQGSFRCDFAFSSIPMYLTRCFPSCRLKRNSWHRVPEGSRSVLKKP